MEYVRPDNTVIIDNSELRSREGNSQEVAILLVAIMIRISRHTLLTNSCSRSCTMVTISNI